MWSSKETDSKAESGMAAAAGAAIHGVGAAIHGVVGGCSVIYCAICCETHTKQYNRQAKRRLDKIY